MPVHPCADGLTKDCFRAYPAWARQALAYKLLHILLPKQLTKNLPRFLSAALIAPGVVLPPGVELPPGTVISPNVSFPPGWTPGDPAPQGVIIPPEVSPTPPDSGDTPPLYVELWEPGPIKGPGAIIPTPSKEETLIATLDTIVGQRSFGFAAHSIGTLCILELTLNAQITKIEARVQRHHNPTGNVYLQLWHIDPAAGPDYIITGGTSESIPASSLPEETDKSTWTLFTFPQKPTITPTASWGLLFHATQTPSSYHYFKTTTNSPPYHLWYNQSTVYTWLSYMDNPPCYKIYGYAL